MSHPERLYRWTETLAHNLPVLSRPKLKVLAAFSLGLALCRRCTLCVVAETLAVLGKPDTVERRLQRFLSGGPLDLAVCQQSLCRWALAPLAGSTLVLLVDETFLQEHLRVMVVCLAYHGRAVPLVWQCYRPCEHPGQVPVIRTLVIRTLLSRLAAVVPADCTVIVQADRGIGSSPNLVQVIVRLGWQYLVRVKGTVRLKLPDGQERVFASVVSQTGQHWQADVALAFKKAGWLPCRALAWWKEGAVEPWLLLTNCPQATAPLYGCRMWEEAAFRDCKSSGWQWQNSRVRDPNHAERLWLVMALAYLWMLSLGTLALQQEPIRRQVARGHDRRRSLLQLGLRLLHRWIETEQELIYHIKLVFH